MDANLITQKAFNAGYIIEKFLPPLSKLLAEGFKDNQSPYTEGFIAGRSEFIKEREPQKFKFLGRLRGEFGDSTHKKHDRDNREMDIDI